jgi:chromosome segregation ATPase
MRGLSRRWSIGIVLALLVLAGTALWAGQVYPTSGKPTIDASMSELVTEVHALRVAVERSSLIAAQSQVVLGRLQLQENRLGTLGRQLQDARQRTRDALETRNEMLRQLKSLTDRADQISAPEERQQMQFALAETKSRLKDFDARVDALRAEESAAGAALGDEQTRWSDFNARLETLERTLATMAAPR